MSGPYRELKLRKVKPAQVRGESTSSRAVSLAIPPVNGGSQALSGPPHSSPWAEALIPTPSFHLTTGEDVEAFPGGTCPGSSHWDVDLPSPGTNPPHTCRQHSDLHLAQLRLPVQAPVSSLQALSLLGLCDLFPTQPTAHLYRLNHSQC